MVEAQTLPIYFIICVDSLVKVGLCSIYREVPFDIFRIIFSGPERYEKDLNPVIENQRRKKTLTRSKKDSPGQTG